MAHAILLSPLSSLLSSSYRSLLPHLPLPGLKAFIDNNLQLSSTYLTYELEVSQQLTEERGEESVRGEKEKRKKETRSTMFIDFSLAKELVRERSRGRE